MKSKSLSNLGHVSAESRTFDFVDLYKNTAETSGSFSERFKSNHNNDTESHKVKSESPKRERSPYKRNKKEKRDKMDISQIIIEGPSRTNSAGESTPLNESKSTSTPRGSRKHEDKSSKVKSIMKIAAATADDTMDDSKTDISISKPKKRNKSVSFMLEDNEEVVHKKTKSDESRSETKSGKAKKQFKKVQKDQQAEKENKIHTNQTVDMSYSVKGKANKKPKTNPEKLKPVHSTSVQSSGQSSQSEYVGDSKKKRKKVKKIKKPEEGTDSKDSTITGTSTSQETPEKTKISKKKKNPEKPLVELDSGEPASKSCKKDAKPDVIAELENLSIGDNAHTLTSLLDEMTVIDKEKRKKLKQKFNKNKKPKGAQTQDSERTEDRPEKVKWMKRKWNKDNKAESKGINLDTTIIVENLALSMLLSYKKVLAEHFVKYGLIKSIGIAEVYATEVSKPVFTTEIKFYSDGAASQALQEDSTMLEGSRITVKRPLPATETTLVVRSYSAHTAQCISSFFVSAGPIRNIRRLVKGKNSSATSFVEFDGPESVERAIKLAVNAKIDGKKIQVFKFENRTKKSKQKKTTNEDEAESEDSQE